MECELITGMPLYKAIIKTLHRSALLRSRSALALYMCFASDREHFEVEKNVERQGKCRRFT